jgi:ubiquinone biosynthesis protein
MNPHPAQKVKRAIEAGIRLWQRFGVAATPQMQQQATRDVEVVRPMPRRQPLRVVDTAPMNLPMAGREVFGAGAIWPLLRLFVWLWACIRFFGGIAGDRLHGRTSVQRSAVRLREVFDDAGVSFAKLAQQLSLRADLLPYAYCAELSKLLDRAQAIPTAEAIAIIERNLGRPLNEMFVAFDPEPIGSASLACVYQATLKSGEQVAVKVRRPGIGPLLAADLRALDWLLILAETLTLVRPGLTKQFRQELRTILMGELNFRAEARYTEMFRLRSETDAAGITSPRVYFQYCTDEVLVTELMSGLWMWELMAAVDRNDQKFLSNARSMGIEPGVVARRLMHSAHRVVLEHNFFHADPHPANLVVLPDSRICFIDFGAVGRFSTETRNTWRELQYHMKNRDIERMVECSVRLAGRLPPMDIDAANESMKEIYADWVRAVSSTDAEWWERSTAQNWLRYVNVASEFGIPVSLETLQFFRATLLYDSIIMRLDKEIDPVREFTVYARAAAKDARRRVHKSAQKRLSGPTGMDSLRIEQLADTATQFAFRLQRTVENPIRHFRNIAGKISYALTMLLRLAYVTVVLGGFGLVADFIAERWFGRKISWSAILESAASVDWFGIVILLVAVVIIRNMLARVSAPDRQPSSER